MKQSQSLKGNRVSGSSEAHGSADDRPPKICPLCGNEESGSHTRRACKEFQRAVREAYKPGDYDAD
jgi:hypothetical protein